MHILMVYVVAIRISDVDLVNGIPFCTNIHKQAH